MKIGVITHWWCFENYGQLLQGFAFQKYLEQHGHFGFIIKYFPGTAFSDKITWRRVLLRLLSWNSFKQSLLAVMRRSRKAQADRRKRIGSLRDFDGFRSANMNYTKKTYRSYSELTRSDEIAADVYSAGSDVVWMMLPFNDDGRVMFLDFGNENAKRISYSASFGNASVSQEYIAFASPLVRKMDAVSVREPTGVDICKRMGRNDVVCVMDPVFLLDSGFYRQKFNIPDQRSGVCGYFLRMKPRIPVSEMTEIAKKLGQDAPKIVTVYDDMGLPDNLLINPTLPEWIRMIGSAKLFVTNSFHGASMAIILHTPFIVMLKDNGRGMDNRLLGLLGRLNLKDRIYDGITNTIDSIGSKMVDWSQVDIALREELKQSLDFLHQNGI